MKHLFTILICSLLLCFATMVKAQGKSALQYSFITPVKGMKALPLWMAGNTVIINWKGGPSTNVNLLLIQMIDFHVYPKSIATDIKNTGSFNWTIPADVPPGIYEVYIEDTKDRNSFHLFSNDFAINNRENLKRDKTKLPSAQ